MAIGVIAPAFDGVVIEECAGVAVSGGDGDGRVSVAEVDCCSWCVDVVVVATVSELTALVVSPAFNGAVVEECAGVAVSGGDGGSDVFVW